MAKDAKGHGSEAHGGSQTPVQQENAPFKSRLGGKNYLDPHDPRNVTIGGKVFPQGYDNLRARADAAAAGALASGPKSAIAPVHDSMGTQLGTAQWPGAQPHSYSAPRDHAAEQRSFNSGSREINRLRRQGK
jgi:hypothetical protein